MEEIVGLSDSTGGDGIASGDCQYRNFHLASAWKLCDESAGERVFTALK